MLDVNTLSEEGRRELMVLLQKCWGAPVHFVRTLLRTHNKELRQGMGTNEEASMFAEAFYHHVHGIWAQYFRCITKPAELDAALHTARQRHSSRDGPMLFYSWVSRHLQKQILAYLETPRGQGRRKQVVLALHEQSLDFSTHIPADWTDLDDAERGLLDWLENQEAFSWPPMEGAAILGWVLETARREARHVVSEKYKASLNWILPRPLARMIHMAEVEQARRRLRAMSRQQRLQHLEELQRRLQNIILNTLEHLSHSLERFQRATEAALMPYPASLEYIRGMLGHAHDKAQELALFDGLESSQIEQRYRELLITRKVEPMTLEIAKTLAICGAPDSQDSHEAQQEQLQALDLAAEFGWPTTIQQALGNASRPAP